MPYVIKTAPFGVTVGTSATLEELALYGGNQVAAGDEVFIWFSEAQGGKGLAWRGTAVERLAVGNRRVSLVVRMTEAAAPGSLDISALAPLRDSSTEDGLSGLARKLSACAQ